MNGDAGDNTADRDGRRLGAPLNLAFPGCLRAVAIVLALGVSAPVSQGGENGTVADTWSNAPRRVIFAQVPGTASGVGLSDDGALPEGSRIVAFNPGEPSGGVTVLTGGFAAAGRPNLSFDASKMLFVARRRATDPLSVWEMNLADNEVRRVTEPGLDCDLAIYLSTTFTLDAERPVELIAFRARSDDGARALYTCHRDGTRVTRITFTPYDVTEPYLLTDSRLLFGIKTPTSSGVRAPATNTGLFTINTDGTDVFPFTGVHDPAAQRATPYETPDEWVVFVESAPSDVDPGGALVAVPRTRSLRIRRVWAKDPAGRYYSPAAVSDRELLVSYRTADGTYGVHLFDRTAGDHVAVFDDPEWHDIHARPVQPRRVPHGHSSVVDDNATTGKLYCLDAYLSEYGSVRDAAPDGVKVLRVVRAMTGPSGSAADVAEKTLGEARLSPDGSFFLEVPARMPLRLELLGDGGEVIQGMSSSWIWVMPQERRGCIGCHEDRELTPPNRHVYALWKRPQRIGLPKPAQSPPRGASKIGEVGR